MHWKEEAEQAAERTLFAAKENYNLSLRIVLRQIFIEGWEACRNSLRCRTCSSYTAIPNHDGYCSKHIKGIEPGFGCIWSTRKDD